MYLPLQAANGNLHSPCCVVEVARKNPRRNISRVEAKSDAGRTYGGWEVRIQRRGRKTAKYFGDNLFGGQRKSLLAAKEFRDSLEQAWQKYTVKELARKPSIRNRSGVVGVRRHKQIDSRGDYEFHYWYWVAQWTDGHGRRRTRSFSVSVFGEDEAFRLAKEARRNGVSQANRG